MLGLLIFQKRFGHRNKTYYDIRDKYNETKNTNFHELIYNLFCKYLENPNFIEEAINNNPEAKGMRTVKEFAAEMLNYRYGLNCY